MEPVNREFGERLRAAREGAGLTQVELAAKVDAPQKQISVWESGRYKPGSIDRLIHVAQAVGATVGWLLTGEGKPPIHATRKTKDRPAGEGNHRAKRKGA